MAINIEKTHHRLYIEKKHMDQRKNMDKKRWWQKKHMDQEKKWISEKNIWIVEKNIWLSKKNMDFENNIGCRKTYGFPKKIQIVKKHWLSEITLDR